MGSQEVLAGLLWRARAGLRLEGTALRAGHGMADQNYRPPRLPYASVVGPLCVEVEPDRDAPRAVSLWVQTPGHLDGAARPAGAVAPTPGTLALRLDGDTVVAGPVDLGPLAGSRLTDAGVGPAVAAAVEAALRGAVFLVDGAPVTDPARLAELAEVTVRWDRTRQRLVVSSGRRGVVAGTDPLARQPSSVTLEQPSPFADALGLGAGAVDVAGLVVRHRRPTPTAVAVDVRFDLWAGAQSALAATVDRWTRVTATRGQLLVRPALLAADVPTGATSLRLDAPAEPPARPTLVQLQPGPAGLTDRLSGAPVALPAGGTPSPSGVTLDAAQRAELGFFRAPPVPLPWDPDHPGARGYAATVGLRAATGADGDVLRVLTVTGRGRTALRLDVAFVVAAAGEVVAELRGTAMRAGSGDLAAATAQVPADRLAAGADVHVLADARTGAVALFLDAEPVGAGPAGAAAVMVGDVDMQLVVGPPDGAPPNPHALTLTHLELHGAPLGPADPRLRASAAPASAWSPGDPVALARSTDGVTTVGEPVTAVVVEVAGDTLVLDRPVQAPFARADTVVFTRSAFFSQRQLRRSDDLMNQLYRMSAEYRVSTFLDEADAGVSAPLVETAEVEVRDFARLAAELADPLDPLYPARPAAGAPGTRTTLVPPPVQARVPSEVQHG